ncbi:hypothetical protein Tco_0195482 [Tanacetum coccineum]
MCLLDPTSGLEQTMDLLLLLDDEIRRDPERDDTYEIYGRLDEAQDARAVLSGWLNLLRRDRCAHAHTALLMEREARLSHEAWRLSMDASDDACSEVMALRTTVLAQQTEIVELRAADRRRQRHLTEALTRSRKWHQKEPQVTPAQQLHPHHVTNAQLKALIDQGFADALAACDADRSRNGEDNHDSGPNVRRTERVARE